MVCCVVESGRDAIDGELSLTFHWSKMQGIGGSRSEAREVWTLDADSAFSWRQPARYWVRVARWKIDEQCELYRKGDVVRGLS